MTYKNAMNTYSSMNHRYMQWMGNSKPQHPSHPRMNICKPAAVQRKPAVGTLNSLSDLCSTEGVNIDCMPNGGVPACEEPGHSTVNRDRYNFSYYDKTNPKMDAGINARLNKGDRDCGASNAYKSDLLDTDDADCGRGNYGINDKGDTKYSSCCSPDPCPNKSRYQSNDREDGSKALIKYTKFSYLATEERGYMKPQDLRASRGSVRECLQWRSHVASEGKKFENWAESQNTTNKSESSCLERVKSILSGLDQNPYVSSPTMVEDHLYIGSLNDAVDHRKLKRTKITYIFDCASTDSGICSYPTSLGITAYDSIPAIDDCCHDMIQYIEKAITFIDMVKRKRARVLVHCIKGINRSAFICAAYMMLRSNKNLYQAVRHLKYTRGIVLTNPSFQKQLVVLAKMHNKD